MKKIVLTGPSVRNNGHYVDGGETVEVGSGAEQIDGERAKTLLDQGRAMTPTDAKATDAAAEGATGESEQAAK